MQPQVVQRPIYRRQRSRSAPAPVSRRKSGISPLDLTALEDDEVPQTFWDVADIGVRYLDPKSLTPSDKLALYAYYKQGTCGDFTGSASALGSLLGNQESIKQMVWQNLKGMTRTEAQRKYLETYEQLYRKLHLEKELPEVQELLLSSIIPTRHRKEWETEGHEAQSLAHFGAELYTTVYPDQLPENLARDYASKVGMRYKRTMMNRYLVDLRAKRAAGPVSDTDFKRYTTQTAFSKLMRPLRELEEGAQKAYLALLEEAEGKRGLCNLEEDDIFLIDATGISVLPVREADGCFVGPSVIFLRSKKNTQDEEEGKGKTPQDPTPFAIALECTQHGTEYPPPASQRFPACLSNLRTVTPDQGLAWEMAKLFSLQAADYLQGLGFHVVLHVLTMNPVLLAFHRTVKELPEGGRMSALACMMGEHAFLALATNSFVFHSEYSVMWPDNKKQPYDAFCCRCDDLPPGEFDHLGGAFHLARLAFEGVEGHPVYRPADDLKQIQMEAYDRKGTGSYLWFLSRVRGAVLRFVASVFSEIEHREEDREFAVRLVENLRKTLPRGSSILKKLPQTDENDTAEECLKWAQTVLVYMVCHSVEHCLDHFLSDTMADATLGRIRAPIDFDNTTTDLRAIHTKIASLNTASDRSKYFLMNEITKKSIPVRTYGQVMTEGGYFLSPPSSNSNSPNCHLLPRDLAETLAGCESVFVQEMTAICDEECDARGGGGLCNLPTSQLPSNFDRSIFRISTNWIVRWNEREKTIVRTVF